MLGDDLPVNDTAFQERIDAVRDRVSIETIVGAVVALGRGRKPRGKCPFHGSNSDSFMVDPDGRSAKCWGCGWYGDVVKFTAEHFGLSFTEALQRLEQEHGLDGLEAKPKAYQKQAQARPQREHVDSATMGRFIWKGATRRPDAARTYLEARGVPASVLTDERLGEIRFHGLAPITSWPADRDGPDPDCPKAPAICALIRRPIIGLDERVRFVPIGLHVTWLSPSLEAKMVRKRRDGTFYPARKMLGDPSGGCVILGATQEAGMYPHAVSIDADAPLFDGEGIETVLSGMAIAKAKPTAIGLAALSLGNLEGQPVRYKGGILPLHDIRPDPERPGLAFPHRGPVTCLVDADMRPLNGPKGEGLLVIERRGGPIVKRPITAAERAEICGQLAVKSWRNAGVLRVRAARPPMGQDFNDAVREARA